MILFPAIDMKEGRCVRLTKGLATDAKIYGDDPVAMARRWASEGAAWLHLVDLDGALAGEPRQLALAAKIAAELTIPVQLGGGLHTIDQIAAALGAGVSRVILGSAAVNRPELVKEAIERFGPGRIVAGIDARRGMVAVKGWQETSGLHFLEVAERVKGLGCRRVIFTDTDRDGMLTGPNIAATKELAVRSGLRVIASGGISSLEDLRALQQLKGCGIEGAILGKSLYEGKIKLAEALAVVGKKD